MRPIDTEPGSAERLSGPFFYGLAVALVFVGYLAVLQITNDGGLLDSAVSSLRNLAALAPAVLLAHAVLTARVRSWPPLRQLALHLALAPVFAFVWYWLLMVLIGLANGESLTKFVVRPFFPGPAVAWQLLQGLAGYAVVAALIYLRAQPAAAAVVLTGPLPQAEDSQKDELSRYFIRAGEDIHPIDVSEIVSIAGADDYAEVTTLTGSHLVRMTLAEFENALNQKSFIRVHRSRIVNVDRIARAEPAGGGRMLLHMENGEMIQCSRTGTRLLKDRVI